MENEDILQPPEWLKDERCIEHYKSLVETNNTVIRNYNELKKDICEVHKEIEEIRYVEVQNNGNGVERKETRDLLLDIQRSLQFFRDMKIIKDKIKKHRLVRKTVFTVLVLVVIIFLFTNPSVATAIIKFLK